MSTAFLKRVVDGLVVNKMNYLHVHFTDVASFPVRNLPVGDAPVLAE